MKLTQILKEIANDQPKIKELAQAITDVTGLSTEIRSNSIMFPKDKEIYWKSESSLKEKIIPILKRYGDEDKFSFIDYYEGEKDERISTPAEIRIKK